MRIRIIYFLFINLIVQSKTYAKAHWFLSSEVEASCSGPQASLNEIKLERTKLAKNLLKSRSCSVDLVSGPLGRLALVKCDLEIVEMWTDSYISCLKLAEFLRSQN